ncbi:hypothetical protein JHK87_018535 [Glycine soja]|nr:hypothetical protein JHK87_018535 [Glycine soja]
MAGGANFVQRVLSYVVNEVVVNGLANSCGEPVMHAEENVLVGPAFQRFAVRTSKRIGDISNKAVQKRQELAEQIKDISKNMEVVC